MHRPCALTVDALEPRMLLSSVSLSRGALVIEGDSTDNSAITVGLSADKAHVVVTIVGAATTTQSFSLSSVKSITIGDGGTGLSDTITIDQTYGVLSVPISISSTGNDTILGGDANETIIATGAAPVIDLGNGRDSVTAVNTALVLVAGNGADTVVINGGDPTVYLGNGNDKIVASYATLFASFGNGSDTLVATGGTDTILMGDGADSITATAVSLNATLGNGNDHIGCINCNLVAVLGNGTDNVGALGTGNDTITVGNGSDFISVGNGNDSITLGDGAMDFVSLGSGIDSVQAGTGLDYIIAPSASIGGDIFTAGGGTLMVL